MWARIVECMLGIWLLMSPFIFHHTDDALGLWINDLAVGCILVVLSLASYWRPTAWAHWLILPVAMWLIGFGRFGSTPPLAGSLQNEIIVGLLLLIFAIIPNHASCPPHEWEPSTSKTADPYQGIDCTTSEN